jgi:hypothetical protein
VGDELSPLPRYAGRGPGTNSWQRLDWERTLGRALAGASFGASLWFTLLVSSGLLDRLYSLRTEARLSAVYAWLAVFAFWLSRQFSFTPGRDLLWLLWQFRRTLVVAVGAGLALVLLRQELMRWFLADRGFLPVSAGSIIFYGKPLAMLLDQLRLVAMALIMVAAPFAATELWSLVARCANSERARRLAVPFGLVSGAAMLAAFVCVRFLLPSIFDTLHGFAGV